MKKFGFRVVLSLILALTFLIVPFGSAAAAPPEKSWIHVTEFVEDNITFDYGWNNVGVYAYSVYVFNSGVPSYYFNHQDLGTRTRSMNNTTVSVNDEGIDAGDQNLHLRLWLYDKHGRLIKHARVDINATVPST